MSNLARYLQPRVPADNSNLIELTQGSAKTPEDVSSDFSLEMAAFTTAARVAFKSPESVF
jgi:hypothetical protein